MRVCFQIFSRRDYSEATNKSSFCVVIAVQRSRSALMGSVGVVEETEVESLLIKIHMD